MAPGLSNPQDWEGWPRQKTQLLSQQIVQVGQVWGWGEGEEEEETSRAFPAPFQCPSKRDFQGTPPGPSPGACTSEQSSLQTLVWWGPPEEATLVSCEWGPGEPGGPRQTTEEGAEGRKEGGSLLVVFACRCWRE